MTFVIDRKLFLICLTLFFTFGKFVVESSNNVDDSNSTHLWPTFEFSFEPRNLTTIKESETSLIRVNVSTNSSTEKIGGKYIKIIVKALQQQNGILTNGSVTTNLEWRPIEDGIYDDRWVGAFEFEIRGVFVGFSKFEIQIVNPSTNLSREFVVYHAMVTRSDTFNLLSRIFTYSMTVLICLNTFVMGLQLQWKVILDVLKRPIAPIIGFCCQFLIMPLLAFLWASLLLPEFPYLQFGYFAVGCAPGGGNSNFWTLLLDGNLDLSVTMTFCSNMAALAMMPFWLFTLGQLFFKNLGGHINIPFGNIILSLVLLIVPCFLGILTTHFRPKWQEKSKKVVRFTTLFIIVVAICFGTASNIYVYKLITAKTLLCGILLPYGGFGLSYLVAFVCRQNHVNCRTIAIETGIQNAGIAILLLSFSLPIPVSDLALVMPVCVLIFTPLPLVVAFIGKVIYQCKHKKERTNSISEKEKEMEILDKTGRAVKSHLDTRTEKTPMI